MWFVRCFNNKEARMEVILVDSSASKLVHDLL